MTITETKTRTITAKYENALYVYFYNPAGTQIMRTEKVGDHEAHDFTTVSYEVDSTHKLVGWAAKKNGTENIADKISVPTDKTSVNVYAIIKEGYWVSFNSDGGSIVDSQFVLHGDKLVLGKDTTPTKPGYSFDGWYNGLTKVENGATVTSSMNLTAHWKAAKVNYTINYWQQKVTDDKNATDTQKTYEYVEAVTKKATTGTRVSATNSKTYKGFKYNANNSSKDVEISGDGTTIINVYYDRVLCTVNFHVDKGGYLWSDWQITKTVTGLYGANLPEGAWDSSSYWTVEKGGGTGCILLTSFDFETAGYADNQGNITTNGVVTTCNFYRQGKSGSASVHYYNEQADGSYKLVQTIKTGGGTLNVHEKYAGYDLYKYTTAKNPGTSSSYWEKQEDVYDGKRLDDYPISIASKLKTYSLSYYNYNSVTKTEKNIKYTASLKSYENYTPARPSELPNYYLFGGWYKDKACTTKFDFNTEKMPNANLQIYAKWTAKKINLTYNLNTPDGTSKKVNGDVAAGTIASTVLPSASVIEGYSFAGWYYADGNGNITKDAFNANDAITKNTSVIGKWLYNGKLTVVYNPGTEESKATVPTDSNIYAGGAKVTVAKNATTTSNKKFLGWKLKGNLYYPGDAFEVNKDLANDDNVITLTAVWGSEEHSTTMSYNPGNGRGSVKKATVKNNESVTLKSETSLGYQAPEAEGKEYYFAGWATSMEDANNGKATYAAGQTVHVDVNGENVLYATWIEKRVITVKAKSGTATYTGKEHKVEGFEATEFTVDGNKYTVEGLTASGATGTDAGNYTSKVTGKAVVKDAADNNVTKQFTVKTENGSLVISKATVTLKSADLNKEYDGKALVNGKTALAKEEGWAEGEGATYAFTGSQTVVGSSANAFSYTLKDGTKADNYTISKTEGTLTVKDRATKYEITVKAKSGTATYTGKEHKVEGFEATEFTVDGNKYTVEGLTASGATGTDAGNYTSKVTGKAVVKDAADNNVTKQFTVKTENGSLVISKATVTLKSADLNKEYDGKALVNGKTALAKEEGWAEGEGATYAFTGSQTVVGSSANAFSYTLKDGTKADNYTISKTEGTLTVKDRATKYEITVKAKSGTATYTGKEHKVEGFEATEFTVDGNKYTVEGLTASGATGTDAGNYTSKVTGKAVVKDAADNNVTKQFTVKTENGSLVISKATVTLKSADLNKEYDGKALVNGKTALAKEEGWAEGEGATYAFTGSQTVVGSSANAFSYTLKDGTKADNYTISKTEGTLTVKDRATKYEITVKAKSGTATYTGKEHKVEGFEATEFTVDGNKYTVEGLTASGATGTDAGNYTSKVTGKAVVKDAADNNVTKQFTVKTENGSLVISKATVTLKSADLNKEYDGKALVNGKTALAKEEGWAEGEGATYAFTGSQTVVGSSANAFSYTLKDGTKADNYTISKTEGTLTVKDRATKYEITVKAKSGTATYTGKEHKVEGFEATEFTVDGNKYTVEGLTASGATGTDAGNYTSKVTGKAVVKDAADNNVTKQFTVKTENGSLVISKATVTLKSADLNKEYDGKALVNGKTALAKEEGWAEGEGATYAFTGSQTVVGSSANAFSYTLKDGTKADNYTISKTEGTLTVKDRATKYEITVKAKSGTATYTGKEHKVEGFEATEFTVDGNKYTVEGLTASGATGTDAGNYTSKVTGKAVVKDAADNNVTKQFTVKTENGSLVISKATVTLKSADLNKEYDGKALVNGKTALAKEEGWAEGEGATYAFTGSQTVVGSSANAFSYTLKDGTKADNYTISKTEGTLTVKDRATKYEITVKAKSGTATYTGKEHKVEGFEATEFTVDGNKYTVEGLTASGATGTDAGNYTSKVTGKAVVKDAADNNVTKQFTVKTENGSLVINRKKYTVETLDGNKTYDGTPLTAGAKINGIIAGEVVEIKTTKSLTDVGNILNDKYELTWKTAKATNYKLDGEKFGTLTVTTQSIDPGTDPEKPNPDYTGAKVNSPSDEVYDGKEHKWIPTVTDKADKKLEAGKDYTVEYSTKNFKDVGTIDVTITGIGNYSGTVKRSYKVTPKEYTVTTDSATKIYSGTALTAGGKVEGIVSGETVEFTTTGSQTEVGSSKNTYELVWKSAKATNYTLAKESIGKLTVKAKSIVPDDKDTPESDKTGITVSEPSDSKYDGKEHREVLTVTDTKTGKELVAGTDYSVTYSSDLVNAGTVKVTVAGLGNYSGSFTKTYKITKRSVTLTSATVSKVYDGSALTNTSITVSGDGFVEGEGASYEVTGSQTEVGNSANSFEYKLNENTLASNYDITKVVGTLTVTAAPAPATPATPGTPSSTTSTTPRTPSAPQVTTPIETVEKETTPKAEPKKEEKVEEEYTPKASPRYYWALINLICAIVTVLFGLLLLISKRHKSEDDDEEDDETKQQTNNDDEEKEQEKKRGLFTRVLAALIAIVSVVFFLVTEDLSLPWTWTDQWTIWMVVLGLVQIVVFFVGRKWKNVDDDEDEEEAQQA